MPPPPPIGGSSSAARKEEPEPSRLDGLENLATYLHRFKPEITARVQEEAKPLHSPATDAPHPKLAEALRRPYPAQAHAITAALKTLQTKPAAFICGEMGVGKTLLGSLIPWLYRRDSRTLIMCPGHLVEKWKREILITVPDSQAEIIQNLSDAIKCLATPRTGKPQFWIISKETGKLSYYDRPGVKIKTIEREAYNQEKDETYTIIEEQCYCPSCGQRIERKPKTDGDLPRPILFHELKKNPHKFCRAVLPKAKPMKDGQPKRCNTPLWAADNHRARKIAIADFFKRRGARFDFFIADEVHELKGADTEQGNALGKLASCSKKVLCLTGTLIGGYSTHLYHLLFRAQPTEMKRAGFTYGKTDSWIDRYGIREIVFKEITNIKGETRCARGAGTTTGSRTGNNERPGISPALFAERLLNSALFLHLEDVAAGLPPITEEPVGIDMDPDLKIAYHRMESDIKSVMDQQLARGNRKLLGRYLQNLLSYTDKPFQNEPIDLGEGSFCIPEELDQEEERNKERKLIELVRANKARGRKCLVFLGFTGTRDTCPRIKKIFTDYGIKSEILYSHTTKKASQREQWIFDHQDAVDALIVNPECVKTGLDLIAFPTVIYLQTGYNVFTLRQSSRRSWRIGQTEPVEIYYLYYNASMQARAVELVGRKLSASTALEGRLTAEGLQTLAGEDEDDAMALARALCQGSTIEGIESTWKALNGTQQLEKLTNEVMDLATYRIDHQPHQAQEGLFDAPAPLLEKEEDLDTEEEPTDVPDRPAAPGTLTMQDLATGVPVKKKLLRGAYNYIPKTAKLPELYKTEHDTDPLVRVKLFCPWSNWTWYLTEYSDIAPDDTPENPSRHIAFGLTDGHEAELGYIHLDELEALRGPGGLKIERDLWLKATPLSVIKKKIHDRDYPSSTEEEEQITEETSLVIEPRYQDAEPEEPTLDNSSDLDLSLDRDNEVRPNVENTPICQAALKPPTRPDESAPIEPSPEPDTLPEPTIEAQQAQVDNLALKTLQPIAVPEDPQPQPIATSALIIGQGRQQATILQFKPRTHKKHKLDPNQDSLF